MTESLFELSGIEYHWPEKGDRLLSGHGCWPTDADLGGWSRSFSAFVWGFTNAAETLVQSVVDGKQRADRIAWPLLYLYRHTVELALKECISEAACYLGDSPNPPIHHRLKDLKKTLFLQFEKLDFPMNDDSTIAFSNVLDELDQFDPSGTTFRYPTDRKGAPHNLPMSHVDIVDLQRGVMKLLNFLDCVSQELASRSERWV